MMKTKTLFLLLWLLPQALLAQVNAVVVHQTNGAQAMFFLADQPVITYSNNNLVITTTAKQMSVPVADIANVTLEEYSVPTKIDGVTIADGGILFRQLSAGSEVRVCTIDGKVVCTSRADDGGNVSLDLSAMPRGVLIISAPGSTIKVNNK
ncbi:MAG: hypothetical protein IJ928_10445 [Prevotella sp.]|nr:hypothetical protein [Prevotella sp.]